MAEAKKQMIYKEAVSPLLNKLTCIGEFASWAGEACAGADDSIGVLALGAVRAAGGAGKGRDGALGALQASAGAGIGVLASGALGAHRHASGGGVPAGRAWPADAHGLGVGVGADWARSADCGC